MILFIDGEAVGLSLDESNLLKDVVDAVAEAHAEYARQIVLGYQTTLHWQLKKKIGEVFVKRRPTDENQNGIQHA